ncbi:NUMOD4 domain-containing protein [Oscillibacter ruminantium]|jgi:hypothetical protein|uniref:NUMOD4 domain-containing protein n=1 Tax=Oscillibacter ruminantium TaxID=1263547 RepID=UPI00058D9177|nr:NUMOD4 domain-containing protein [Oscillibacter ruminantium]
MNEIWKPIPGYEGDYEVSSYGKVKSLKYGKERILYQEILTGGYAYVKLCRQNRKKQFRVHRLVAMAFIQNPNPTLLLEVNHKDENVSNNHVDNLEWISPSKNKSFGTRNVRISDSKKKTIEKLDPKSGNVVGSFLGAVAAAKSCGLHSASSIRKCCRGAVRFCDGYEWRYAENG